ncbi:unnamed protein product, partial [Mesorhabditis spiculigera]
CNLLRVSYDTIRNLGGQVMAAEPVCQHANGQFSTVQCELSGSCRCVEPSTGAEVLGSKKVPLIGQDVCSAPLALCAVRCVVGCPFGVETDGVGCPLAGEPNPCSRGHPPASDSRTFAPFECKKDRSMLCPADYYCAGEDGNGRGVCCPGGESPASSQCPHGQPYSVGAEGSVAECTALANGCPATHYCLTKPGSTAGVCCVTKRHVCHVKADPGGCSLSNQRYYYSADERTCLPMEYGGCGGNLNNFPTRDLCERFCEGIGFNMDTPLLSDDGRVSEQYEMGFMLKGPKVESQARGQLKADLLAALLSRFGLTEREVRDLSLRGADAVRFVVQSPDARVKAQRIHEAVMDGSLLVRHKNGIYVAEPQTCRGSSSRKIKTVTRHALHQQIADLIHSRIGCR